MRRFPTALAIFLLAVIIGIIGWRNSMPEWFQHQKMVAAQHGSKSEFYARLTITYDTPPIYQEEYRMQDIEGVSSFDYRVRGYSGKEVTISNEKRKRIDVSSFCGVNGTLDQIGVWQIVNKPPRPDATVHYAVYVKEVVDFKQGDRTVTFTDPKYWATTAGQQYHIDLSKENADSLLSLKGTSIADPRYQKIVDAFRAFGPDIFLKDVVAARKTVEASK